MAKYLVTGGAGFIGSHITEELLKRGDEVRILDNFLTGKRENLNSVFNSIELIEGDIRDLEMCRKAAKGIDYILHQAALPSVPRSISDPLTSNEINITGTLNVLISAHEQGVQNFILASSSSVYGDDPRLPKKVGQEGVPLSPYALNKLAGEKYCQIFSKIHGLPTVCLRYFNVFGPRQDPFSQYAAVIPLFITKMLKNEQPTIFGDGEQSRDFSYISNVVDANILASLAKNVSGEVMNVACGVRTTVNALVDNINVLIESEIQASYEESRPGDVRHSHADILKAEQLLNYKPTVTFNEGLKRTLSWYRNQ